jgi:hypothetical protein
VEHRRRWCLSSSAAGFGSLYKRWQAGYNDAKIALIEPRVFELPHVREAARIFNVHRGWMT